MNEKRLMDAVEFYGMKIAEAMREQLPAMSEVTYYSVDVMAGGYTTIYAQDTAGTRYLVHGYLGDTYTKIVPPEAATSEGASDQNGK